MIPDKPGYWWFESREGEVEIAHVHYYLGFLEASPARYSFSMVINHSYFAKWLGPVNPEPMKVSGE